MVENSGDEKKGGSKVHGSNKHEDVITSENRLETLHISTEINMYSLA